MSGFDCQVHRRRVGQQGSLIHVTEACEIILAAVGDVMPTGRHVESVASLHRLCAMLADVAASGGMVDAGRRAAFTALFHGLRPGT